MKRKILSTLLAVLMLAALLPLGALADDTDAVAKIGDTYYNTLAEALAAVKNGGTITLLRDIDLDNQPWTPLSRSNVGFTFDGDGHTISNLKVNTTSNSAGLFGSIGFSESTTTIRNLNLHNVDVRGNSYVGAVAGWITGTAVFENITVSGDVKVQANAQNAGGILGHSAGVITVNNCHINATSGSYVKSNTTSGGGAGGIVGFAANEGSKACTISNCTVKNLDVSGYHRIGGIVGMMQLVSGTYPSVHIYVTDNSVENVHVTVTGGSAATLNNRHDAQVGLIVGATTDNGGRSRHHYYNNTYSGDCLVTATTGAIDIIPTALYGLWTLGAARVKDYGQTNVGWYNTNGNADIIYADGAAGEVTFGGTEYITFLTAYRAGESSADNPFILHTDVGYKLKPTDKIYVEANGNIFYPFADAGYEIQVTEISETVKLYELISVAEVKAEKIALLNSYPSSEVIDDIIAQGIAVINAATTVEEVINAYNSTVQAIEAALQAAELAAAKAEAKARLVEAAGEDPSAAMQAIVDEYCARIDSAETISEVESIEEEGLQAIKAQYDKEHPIKELITIEKIIRKFFGYIGKIIDFIKSFFTFT